MVVYLYVALRWIGDLFRVYPAFPPMSAGIRSSPPRTLYAGYTVDDGWMDGSSDLSSRAVSKRSFVHSFVS